MRNQSTEQAIRPFLTLCPGIERMIPFKLRLAWSAWQVFGLSVQFAGDPTAGKTPVAVRTVNEPFRAIAAGVLIDGVIGIV
jgi:hypothetical protein